MKGKSILAGAVLLGFAPPAGGYIEAVYPLKQFIDEAEVIAEGTVEKVDAATQTFVVKVNKSLKGKCPHDRIRVNVGVGQGWHVEVLLRHATVGAPAVFFHNDAAGELYLNRFFLQLYRDENTPVTQAWWNFTHVEIRCNRTFNGTVEQLQKSVVDALSGRQKPPSPDPRLPAITKESLQALPPPGTRVDESKLPPPFRKSAPFKPRSPDPAARAKAGLKFEYYEGEWQGYPDYVKLTPTKKGLTEQFDLSKKARDTNIAFRFTGFVHVPRDGTYVFHTSSAGGNKLLIGTTEVFSKDLAYAGSAIETCGGIDLKAGKHTISVLFFDAGAGQDLAVFWEGPGIEKTPIPPTALFHSP